MIVKLCSIALWMTDSRSIRDKFYSHSSEFLSLPPKSHCWWSTRPRLYFLFTINVSSISIILSGPSIFITIVFLFFVFFQWNSGTHPYKIWVRQLQFASSNCSHFKINQSGYLLVHKCINKIIFIFAHANYDPCFMAPILDFFRQSR